MVACYHSTLGFELLSKKIKVFFLPLHERKFKKTYHLEKEDNFHIHRKIEKRRFLRKCIVCYTLVKKLGEKNK